MKPQLKKKIAEANAVFMISKLIERYPQYVRDISDFQFDRVIGKGGFGEVWLGHDLRTGKLCAIKELHSERLTPHGVTSFLREINTMVKLRNERFILPFVGYTIDSPYCLITEYVPNGTLYAYTHKAKKKATLSDTHLNINAMCIAYGMMKMHEMSVVHRDLKTLNILLDHNYLPMICDFGTSRNVIEKSHRKMTPYTGTITHMAPEVLFMRPHPNFNKEQNKEKNDNPDKKKDLRELIDFSKVPVFENYGLSCDVYSYGMVLYEMSQGQIPFGISKEHIVMCIQNNEKPQIKRPTPKSLVELIYSCINHNPSKRPTFQEIYNKFKTGEVHFSTSDFRTVSKFAEELEKIGQRNLPPPPVNPTVDIPSILQRMYRQHEKLKKQVAEMEEAEKAGSTSNENKSKINSINEKQSQIKLGNESEDEASLSILADTSNALFMSTLTTFSDKIFNEDSKLNIIKFDKFYKTITKHFKDGTLSPVRLAAIIDSFTEIAKKDTACLEHLEKMRFFSFLPVNPEKVILNSLYELIWLIFEKKPNLAGHSLFRTLGLLLLNPKEQEKALALFNVYAMKFEEVDDPYKIFDFLISYASAFLESKDGPSYISIFVFVLLNNAEFRSMRLRRLMNIFAVMCRSHNRLVAYEASKAFATFYEPSLSEKAVQTAQIQGEIIVDDTGSTPSLSRSSLYQSNEHNSTLSNLSEASSTNSAAKDPSFGSLKNALYENQRRDASLSSLFQVNNENQEGGTKGIRLLLGENETAPAAPNSSSETNSQKTANSGNVSVNSALSLDSGKDDQSNQEGETGPSSSQPIVRVPYKAIIRNLMDKQLQRPSLSILKRVDHFPASRTFFRLLLRCLPQSSGVVFKFVSENSENAVIAAKYTRWMQSPTTISFKVFMLIFKHKEARETIISDEKGIRLVATYFTSVLATAKSSEILAAVGSIVKRLPLNKEFLEQLTSVGFFINMSFIVARYIDDQAVVQSCLSFVSSVSKIGYSADFMMFVEPLVKMLSLKNDTSKAAILIIAELSKFKELAMTFSKMNLVPYYTQLLKTKYKQVAASFLNNIEKFSKEDEEK